MRWTRRGFPVLCVLIPVVLAACSAPSGAGPTQVTRTSPSTVGGSEVTRPQALREARLAYEGYLSTAAAVAADKGKNPDRLRVYLTARAVESELDGLKEIAGHGWTVKGESRLRGFKIQSFDSRTGVLTAYACVDLTRARIVDSAAKDVTPAGRANLQTSLPRFVRVGSSMKLDENGTWSGKSIC